MIGIKSLAAFGLVTAIVVVALLHGRFGEAHVAVLSAASAFAVGLFASASTALIGFAWRPELPSRAALDVRGGRPRFVGDAAGTRVRELPAVVQRALFVLGFAAIALGTFDNVATARIASVPANLAEPSHAEYCGLEAKPVVEEAPPPVLEQPVDQAGCALVKRAVKLGYKKDLGSCAPKVIKRESPAIKREREVCTKRQLDEPFLHFMTRRVVEASSDASPLASASTWADDFQIRTNHVADFLGDIRNSVTGAPHASHHIWVNVPDPHPPSVLDRFTGHMPCASRYAGLALWPRWSATTPPGIMVEHVLGQLLFATRFGTTASCSDYTIHWGAPADACTRLAADPVAFLDDAGALTPMRAVLDRRNRQLALRALAHELGRTQALPEPPPARFIVSASCFVVGSAGPAQPSGREIIVDGEPVAMREIHVPALRPTGDGPVDLYSQLALLLGGTPYAGPAATRHDRVSAEPPAKLDDPTLPLLRLEPLADADPFLGARGPLGDAEVQDVYPFEHHLFAFVDSFRRAYLPQRGRL